MPKIRDLGISFIPEALVAAGKKKPQCYGKTKCERTSGVCDNDTACPDPSVGCLLKSTKAGKPPTKRKKKTISRKAVEQLHAQMQRKIAHTDLTK
jgi:hypothetical protein